MLFSPSFCLSVRRQCQDRRDSERHRLLLPSLLADPVLLPLSLSSVPAPTAKSDPYPAPHPTLARKIVQSLSPRGKILHIHVGHVQNMTIIAEPYLDLHRNVVE